MKLNYRLLSFGGFLACAGAMAFALYLEYFKGYEPCPMCIFQRVAMIFCGTFFLIGALLGPRKWGRWVFASLANLAAIAGALVAARHVWLQSIPEDQVPACGPTLQYLLNMFPWNKVVMMVLKGDASCAKITAQWLGLSLPMWTLIGFAGLIAYGISVPVLARVFEREQLEDMK
ncbi:MAG: disulfide bond formation protein B [Stenotrophobium sp.]